MSRRLWRNLNPTLVLGLVLLAGLLLLCAVPGRLAPHDPARMQAIRITDGGMCRPPFPPGDEHPLGTDEWGRDLLSRVVFGARYTMSLALAVLAVSLAAALPMGLFAGWSGGWVRRLLDYIHAATSALPAFIICLVVLKSCFLLNLSLNASVILYVAVLAATGWPSLAQSISRQVVQIRREAFVEGAVAAGAGGGRIIYRHILPHVLPSLLVLGTLEIARALLLMAQLGLFNVFIGGGEIHEWIPDLKVLVHEVPEWSQMLSDPTDFLRSAPWNPLVPATAFALAILTFNLLADGIGQYLTKRWQG